DCERRAPQRRTRRQRRPRLWRRPRREEKRTRHRRRRQHQDQARPDAKVKVAAEITMQTKTLIPTTSGLFLLGACLLAPSLFAQERGGTDDPKRWQAVPPGRVEPWSGEIKITAAAIGTIGELLVKPTDKVFAGELLMRLRDEEVVTRLATAEAQVAMRKRAGNERAA